MASGAPFSRVALVESKARVLHGRPIAAFTVAARLAPPNDATGPRGKQSDP